MLKIVIMLTETMIDDGQIRKVQRDGKEGY